MRTGKREIRQFRLPAKASRNYVVNREPADLSLCRQAAVLTGIPCSGYNYSADLFGEEAQGVFTNSGNAS